jgi:hypothetical protein
MMKDVGRSQAPAVKEDGMRTRTSSLLCATVLLLIAGCAYLKANPSVPATVASVASEIVTQLLPQAKGNAAFVAEIKTLQADIALGKSDVVLNVFNDANGPLAQSGGPLFALLWEGLHASLPLLPVTPGDVDAAFALEQSVAVAIVQGCARGLGLPSAVPGVLGTPVG